MPYSKLIQRLMPILLGLWLGVQWGIGFLAVPTLFHLLPREQAGDVAVVLFLYVSWMSLMVWLFFLLFGLRQMGDVPKSKFALVLVLLLVQALELWVVFPTVATLKQHDVNLAISLFGGDFTAWHQVASLFYVLISVLGLYLSGCFLRLNQQWR